MDRLKSQIEPLRAACPKPERRQSQAYPIEPIPASPEDPCLERRLIEERIKALLKIAERNATFGLSDEFADQAAAAQVKLLRERLAGLPTDCPTPAAPTPATSTDPKVAAGPVTPNPNDDLFLPRDPPKAPYQPGGGRPPVVFGEPRYFPELQYELATESARNPCSRSEAFAIMGDLERRAYFAEKAARSPDQIEADSSAGLSMAGQLIELAKAGELREAGAAGEAYRERQAGAAKLARDRIAELSRMIDANVFEAPCVQAPAAAPSPTGNPGSVGTTPTPTPSGSGATTTRPMPQPILPPWGAGPKPYDPSTDPDFGKLHTAGLQRLVEGLEKLRAEDLVKRQELERARCEGPKAWNEKRAAYLKRLRGGLDIMTRITGLGKDKAAIESAAAAEVVRLGGEIAEVEAMSPPEDPQSCPATPVPEEGESILDEIEEVFVPA